jgi:hypothetical protein
MEELIFALQSNQIWKGSWIWWNLHWIPQRRRKKIGLFCCSKWYSFYVKAAENFQTSQGDIQYADDIALKYHTWCQPKAGSNVQIQHVGLLKYLDVTLAERSPTKHIWKRLQRKLVIALIWSENYLEWTRVLMRKLSEQLRYSLDRLYCRKLSTSLAEQCTIN